MRGARAYLIDQAADDSSDEIRCGVGGSVLGENIHRIADPGEEALENYVARVPAGAAGTAPECGRRVRGEVQHTRMGDDGAAGVGPVVVAAVLRGRHGDRIRRSDSDAERQTLCHSRTPFENCVAR